MSGRRNRGAGAAGRLTRRRFVALLAGGSAAIAAAPALAAGTASSDRASPAPKPAPAAASASARQKEFERQRAGTLEVLQRIRGTALPPGGDLSVVFRPLRPARRER